MAAAVSHHNYGGGGCIFGSGVVSNGRRRRRITKILTIIEEGERSRAREVTTHVSDPIVSASDVGSTVFSNCYK